MDGHRLRAFAEDLVEVARLQVARALGGDRVAVHAVALPHDRHARSLDGLDVAFVRGRVGSGLGRVRVEFRVNPNASPNANSPGSMLSILPAP